MSTGKLIVFKCRNDELETYNRQIFGYTRESCDSRGIEDYFNEFNRHASSCFMYIIKLSLIRYS